jgi:hypothetical protein
VTGVVLDTDASYPICSGNASVEAVVWFDSSQWWILPRGR